MLGEFYSAYKRGKLKLNAGKSKVIFFERKEAKVVDFITTAVKSTCCGNELPERSMRCGKIGR